jgi:predicted nucleic acid-binding protein
MLLIPGTRRPIHFADTFWRRLLLEDATVLTSNYVVVELVAVAQRRLGFEAVREFHQSILPVVSLHWVDQDAHEAAIAAYLTAARRQLSLIDCTSFEVMRYLQIRDVFVFDPHFAEQGFVCHPG